MCVMSLHLAMAAQTIITSNSINNPERAPKLLKRQESAKHLTISLLISAPFSLYTLDNESTNFSKSNCRSGQSASVNQTAFMFVGFCSKIGSLGAPANSRVLFCRQIDR